MKIDCDPMFQITIKVGQTQNVTTPNTSHTATPRMEMHKGGGRKSWAEEEESSSSIRSRRSRSPPTQQFKGVLFIRQCFISAEEERSLTFHKGRYQAARYFQKEL